MSDKKQIAINFIAQILFNIVNLGVSFFLVPHIVSTINASAYGFFSLSNDFVNYAGLITIALNSLAGRYITINLHKKKYKEANKYFNSVIMANIIISSFMSLFAIIFIIFINNILNIPSAILNDVRLLFILVFINFLISIITSNLSVATFTSNKLYLSSIINILIQIIRCILLVTFYIFMTPKVWYLGLISLIGTGITSIANFIYIKKLTPQLHLDIKLFNFKYIIELIKSGIWNTITRLSSIINNGLDLLIANILVGSEAMGILSLPRSVHAIILNLFSSLGGIFAPKITVSYAKGKTNEILEQINFSYKFLGLFSNVVLAVFMSLGLSFFKLWVPSQNCELLYLIAIISCSALIIALPMEPFYNVHTALNKIKVPAIASIIFSVTTIIIEFIGLSLTDSLTIKLLFISSTSTFIGLFRVLFFLPMYTAKILNKKITYFYKLISKNTLSFMISLFVGLFLEKIFIINSWIIFIIISIIIAIITIFITYEVNFNKQEKEKFKIILKNKLLRK